MREDGEESDKSHSVTQGDIGGKPPLISRVELKKERRERWRKKKERKRVRKKKSWKDEVSQAVTRTKAKSFDNQ